MSFRERFRKGKVVAQNVSRAFGAVGNELSGGFLGGKKQGTYEPLRYKPSRAVAKDVTPISAVKAVAKGAGKLSAGYHKYGLNGSPQYAAAQNQFFTGSKGGNRVGKAQGNFFSGSMTSVKQPRNVEDAGSVKNPYFNYRKV